MRKSGGVFSENSKNEKEDEEILQKADIEKDKEKTEKKNNWIDFYSTNQDIDTPLSKFLTMKMFENNNFSQKFVDFLKECLIFDPKDRLKPFDLLSHPIFRRYNKIYISQQITITYPVTTVEKHSLKKLRN